MKTSVLTCYSACCLGLTLACGGGDDGPAKGESVEPVVSGDITTWAGDGHQGHDGDGNFRTESWFNQPMEVTFDADGSAFVVDWNNHTIRTIDTEGMVGTLTGTPIPGDWPCQIPADPNSCEVPLSGQVLGTSLGMNHPMDVVRLSDTELVIAAWHNHKIELCNSVTDQVSVVAGQQKPGLAGDDGTAPPLLNFPSSIVLDASGALLVADQRNNRVRRILLDTAVSIKTVAGASAPPPPVTTPPTPPTPPTVPAYSGDTGPAGLARLGLAPYTVEDGAANPPPGGALALSPTGELYISDTFNHCVRRVVPGSDGILGEGDAAEEIIDVVVGTCGEAGSSGDGGPALAALLNRPFDLELGPDGRLYLADTQNHVVRVVDLQTGTINRFAGTGEPGSTGDGFPALEAQLKTPYGLAFDAAGNLFIVDTGNNKIRQVLK